MAYTKRELIADMFGEIGLGEYAFDLPAKKWQAALRRMDRLAGQWIEDGIDLAYPVPDNPEDSFLDEPSWLSTDQAQAMVLKLGILTAPSFGKGVSPDTRNNAKHALDTILLAGTMPEPRQLPSNTPVGAGYKNTDFPFTGEPE